jgi:adenylate cyclase class IV
VEISSPQYEVEIRCHFDTTGDAYKAIPFLHSTLTHEMAWSSSFYGQELFRSGQLLRMSKTTVDKKTIYYLGWKGCDAGAFANIREELDEVITDGIGDSQILRKLGVQIRTLGRKDITGELRRLGHHKFMAFQGHDLFGNYKPLDVSMKLMTCHSLKWPLLVEFEKMAHTEEEARQFEKDLYELSRQLKLENYLVKEEPPTQLYTAVFGT